MKRLIISASFTLTGLFSFGQNKTTQPAGNWTVDPFENKEFIENKGQFNGEDNLSSDPILFAVNREGLKIYFTARGLTYRHDQLELKQDEEKGNNKNEEELENKLESVIHSVDMQ